jgi:hypothetical protein
MESLRTSCLHVPLYLSAIGSDVFSLPATANDRMTSCPLSTSRRRGCYTFRQCKGQIPLSAGPNGGNCAPPQPKVECDTCHFLALPPGQNWQLHWAGVIYDKSSKGLAQLALFRYSPLFLRIQRFSYQYPCCNQVQFQIEIRKKFGPGGRNSAIFGTF